MRWWPTSLRSRLTLWYTILLGLPVIVFAVICYVVVSGTLERRTDIFIGDALSAFSRELEAERRASMTVVDAMRTAVTEVRFRELHIAILDSNAQVVAMNALAEDEEVSSASRRPTPDIEQRMLDSVRARAHGTPIAITVPSARGDFRMLARPLDVGGHRYTLTGAYSLRDIDDVLQRVRTMFLLAIPLLLITASFGGYSLARRSLAPVAAMSAQAAAITVSNMHERLPVGGGDELVGLASVVNGLLDRLENAFDQQRRFVTDASHELRTPTAVVRTEADITLSRDHREESEYRESVTVMQDAARRLTRIVDDLFLLSRADSGHLVMRRSPLYLEDLVHDATRAVTGVAHQRGVAIDVRELADAPFDGDADLLGRLLLNLLDNAIKYSPSGSQVDVSLQRRNGHFEIRVGDAGPGIPPESQEQVFDRFYRVDNARSRAETSATSGAGLGLAIARRIAEVHNGGVELAESRPGRTEFLVTLPAHDVAG
ncbi:MAG: HAMP domain-containing protein [Gemmatimonadaceae bacterium]|nr:HAMP domain-containing protein [Gemmatimonadaceae bacterium]